MPSQISAYLDLTPQDASSQWVRILARKPQRRQEPFLPVETLLCYGLFRVLNPHSYGGANIQRVPQEVHTLAAVFQRPLGSITSKMLNLDGSRTNCGRHEPELFIVLAGSRDQFGSLYRTIISAARRAGLEEDQVPDFLGLLGSGELDLLGQDELGTAEIRGVLHERRERIGILSRAFEFTEQSTTRIVEQAVRFGQHRFASAVLGNYDHRCGFCGFQPKHLAGHRLLVASHIKPWRDSNDRERLDPRNGVAACPVHDSAFDTGLLTVNGGLRVHRAEPLKRSLAADDGVVRYFGEPVLQERLILPEGAVQPARKYLRWHRQRIFRGESVP